MLGLRIAACFLEPRVMIRGMVHDEVNEDSDTALFCGMCEINKVTKRAVARVDTVIVRHGVAVVAVRRGLERH